MYKCNKDWVRHSKGSIIEDYEYNKLPSEVKKHFEHVEVISTPFVVEQHQPLVVPSPEEIQEVVQTTEITHSEPLPNLESTADIDTILQNSSKKKLNEKWKNNI